MKLFGEVLFSNGEDEDIPFSKLKRLLEMPYLKPRYRLSVLTQDEQVAYFENNKKPDNMSLRKYCKNALDSINYTE